METYQRWLGHLFAVCSILFGVYAGFVGATRTKADFPARSYSSPSYSTSYRSKSSRTVYVTDSGTVWITFCCFTGAGFNPRPPARGATAELQIMPASDFPFQSTPPARGGQRYRQAVKDRRQLWLSLVKELELLKQLLKNNTGSFSHYLRLFWEPGESGSDELTDAAIAQTDSSDREHLMALRALADMNAEKPIERDSSGYCWESKSACARAARA